MSTPELLRSLKHNLERRIEEFRLPPAAKAELRRDRCGLGTDPGPEAVIEATTAWLCRAQDASLTHDGGVARHYSFIDGWSVSYPETTGYIVPTILSQARRRGDDALRQRARRMLDWLVAIQFEDGAFQGGKIGDEPKVPVAFNTGQILIGLAAGVQEFGGTYEDAMHKAARWLLANQDPDGAWSKHCSPFALPGPKTYDTHIGWGLAEAARISGERRYEDAVRKNLEWAAMYQQPNGWFARCCLTDPERPLTHTIGYVLRGFVEGYRLLRESWILEVAMRTARALLVALRDDGFLPGRLDRDWAPAARYCCLTGTAQIAACWFLLAAHASVPEQFLQAAARANAFVRRTVRVAAPADIRGGVKGSWPVDGEYGRFQLLNWAAKFTIDANQLELDLRRGSP